MNKQFTVIGYYPDNDQPWATCVSAGSWEDAIQAAKHDIHAGSTVCVCAVLAGDQKCVDHLEVTEEICSAEDEERLDSKIHGMLNCMRAHVLAMRANGEDEKEN